MKTMTKAETQKRCTSCKRGDIEGIAAEGPNGEQIQVTVLDPESGKIELRGYLCEEHYSMYADDGYRIVEDRRRKPTDSGSAARWECWTCAYQWTPGPRLLPKGYRQTDGEFHPKRVDLDAHYHKNAGHDVRPAEVR